jgi:hypothetical protein
MQRLKIGDKLDIVVRDSLGNPTFSIYGEIDKVDEERQIYSYKSSNGYGAVTFEFVSEMGK